MEPRTDIPAGEYVSHAVRKLFSLTQAERALVLVRRITADASIAYSQLLQTQAVLEKIQRCGPIDRLRELKAEMVAWVNRLEDCLEELEAVGVDLRDPGRGEVDFPAVVGGRLVCLCWQLGEPQIGHWHAPRADFSQRRPLSELVGADLAAWAGGC